MSHRKFTRTEPIKKSMRERMISYTEGYLLALGDIESDLESLEGNASRAALIQGLHDKIGESRESARNQLHYWVERAYAD